MNSMNEVFPTPVPPTRRMVYDARLFFDVLMTPFLRDSTSLKNTVTTDALKDIVGTYLIVGVSSLSSELEMSPSSEWFRKVLRARGT